MRDEPVATAAVVLVVSLFFDAAGVGLFFVGGVAVFFAIVLIAFGVMGMFQAVAIAFERQKPRSRSAEQPHDEDHHTPR